MQYVAIDEADKMLALGLRPQLERIRAAVLPQTPATGSLLVERKARRSKDSGAGGNVDKRREPAPGLQIIHEGGSSAGCSPRPAVHKRPQVWPVPLCLSLV